MTIPIRGISHVTFSVSDLQRSLLFYQEVFGATLLLRGERMAYLNVGGLWVALNVQTDIPRQEIRLSYTHLAFAVDMDDLGRLQERLRQRGVSPLPGRFRAEGEGQSLYFTDPDGHLLEFHAGDLKTRLDAYEDTADVVILLQQAGQPHAPRSTCELSQTENKSSSGTVKEDVPGMG